jgi:hypothetical protein
MGVPLTAKRPVLPAMEEMVPTEEMEELARAQSVFWVLVR